jgi:Holliday junction resolvasome RuvABC DNA-binding subunit
LRQRKSTRGQLEARVLVPMPAVWQEHETGEVAKERLTTLEKVRLALRGLGFRDAEARRAVAAVANRHDPVEPLALEQALREALALATAA